MALRTKVKYGLSAAMLALIAAGAGAPQLLDQFLQEREGNTLVPGPLICLMRYTGG